MAVTEAVTKVEIEEKPEESLFLIFCLFICQ
jgi:hypothetical protein